MAEKDKDSSPEEVQDLKKKKEEQIKLLISRVNKEIGGEGDDIVTRMVDGPTRVPSFSSGSMVFDGVIGGGIPKGRIVEIFGPESSGKTSIALTAAANLQKEGGTVAFIDFENALDPVYATKLGVNVKELILSQPESAEQGLKIIQQFTESGIVDLIILDSVAAMPAEAAIQGEIGDAHIALLPRLLSTNLPIFIRSAAKTNTTIIFINQERTKIGGFSRPGMIPMETPGGKALKFFASLRIKVNRADQIKEGKEVIGTLVKIRCLKNKVAPPFGEGKTVLTFSKGINVAAEFVEAGPDYGVIFMPNNRTYIESETGQIIGKSKAEAVAHLEQDEEMRDRLSAAVKEQAARRAADPNFDMKMEEEVAELVRVYKENKK